MKLTAKVCILFMIPAIGARLRKKKRVFKLQSVFSKGSDNEHRRLLQNGGAFIVSKVSDDVDWCLDAVEGAFRADGSRPALGFRPCCFNSGPTEQLFRPSSDTIETAFDSDTCLLVGDGFGTAQDGQKVNLGPCDRNLAKFDFEDLGKTGQIKVASNNNLCLTNQGTTPEDDDTIIVTSCQNEDRFDFMFRSGYYFLSAEYCVVVRNNDATAGNRVTWDNCKDAGFGAHWRIDGDGLFHSRLDDDLCMKAVSIQQGAAIRLAQCEKSDKQRFNWEFESPISLKADPDLYLEVQGQNDDPGDPMVLDKDATEWSGDAVHGRPW